MSQKFVILFLLTTVQVAHSMEKERKGVFLEEALVRPARPSVIPALLKKDSFVKVLADVQEGMPPVESSTSSQQVDDSTITTSLANPPVQQIASHSELQEAITTALADDIKTANRTKSIQTRRNTLLQNLTSKYDLDFVKKLINPGPHSNRKTEEDKLHIKNNLAALSEEIYHLSDTEYNRLRIALNHRSQRKRKQH